MSYSDTPGSGPLDQFVCKLEHGDDPRSDRAAVTRVANHAPEGVSTSFQPIDVGGRGPDPDDLPRVRLTALGPADSLAVMCRPLDGTAPSAHHRVTLAEADFIASSPWGARAENGLCSENAASPSLA